MAGRVDESSLDALVAGSKTPMDVASLYTQMLQRVIDRGLNAELDAHPDYARHNKGVDGTRTNARNGSINKNRHIHRSASILRRGATTSK